MLDVHPPEHGIHGTRDFFVHMLTITAGLLIALGLEAGVEALHHRNQRVEAETMIRRELEQNREDLVKAQGDIKLELTSMVAVLDFVEARSKGEAGNPAGLSLGFHEGPLKDAAWRTAGSTGVLNYVEYATVEKYALAYKEQDQFELMQQQALDEYLQLDSFVVKGFDPKNVTAEDLKAALPVVRQTLAHLGGMMDVSRGAVMAYDDALK